MFTFETYLMLHCHCLIFSYTNKYYSCAYNKDYDKNNNEKEKNASLLTL